MKKIFIFLLFVSITTKLSAQEIRLNAYSSYIFDDRIDSYYDPSSYYNGTIQGGWQYGGGLEYKANPYYGVELIYLRLQTTAPIEYFNGGVKFSNFDLNVNHFMVAGNRYFTPAGSKVEGYAGGMIGLNVMDLTDPTTGRGGDQGYFAWGIRLGGNIWLNDRLGIKLQTHLISSAQSVGGGLYFGTGGVSTGLSSYSSIYQFGMGGGLIVKVK